MKIQLIMLDTPIIVSDEKIQVKDYAIQFETEEIFYIQEVLEDDHLYLDNTGKRHWNNYDPWVCRKIIAGIEGLPKIDWNGLEEEFGWVDVDNLSDEIADSIHERWHVGEERGCAYLGAVQGFKKAQSLNDKKFSLEDIEKAMIKGDSLEQFWEDCCKPIQQPKVFDIEIDGDWNKEFYELDNKKNVPKVWKPRIINNSIKILRKL